MKMIDFGREEKENPKGAFDEIGTKDGILNGFFIDFAGVGGSIYVVSKVINVFQDSRLKVGEYYVKEAIVDLYANGSGVLFINSGNNEMCLLLEERLNKPEVKSMIENGRGLSLILGSYMAPKAFDAVTEGRDIMATEISEEVFNRKKELINSCHESISEMQERLLENHKQLIK